ncbi:hypothetical protein [uncultured Psychromonas sp.]|uniref:hypothetical protein n=1 Tax=uncultured Psychromonas sp. TaxID=173974 RepID=UPI002621709D|nr:hypothetical protein [uncultured Psychromonas sp.]
MLDDLKALLEVEWGNATSYSKALIENIPAPDENEKKVIFNRLNKVYPMLHNILIIKESSPVSAKIRETFLKNDLADLINFYVLPLMRDVPQSVTYLNDAELKQKKRKQNHGKINKARLALEESIKFLEKEEGWRLDGNEKENLDSALKAIEKISRKRIDTYNLKSINRDRRGGLDASIKEFNSRLNIKYGFENGKIFDGGVNRQSETPTEFGIVLNELFDDKQAYIKQNQYKDRKIKSKKGITTR